MKDPVADDPGAAERILVATYELLGQVSYRALTMDAIARRVGVSKSLLFYYFGSKREMVRLALRKGFEMEMDRLEAMVGTDGKSFVEYLPDLLRTTMERYNLIGAFFEVVDLDDPEDELTTDLRSEYRTLTESLEPVVSSMGASHPRERVVLGLMVVDMFGLIPHLVGPEFDLDDYVGALTAMMGLDGVRETDGQEERP